MIVLLFGAGKSAASLIQYLVEQAPVVHWNVLVADSDKDLILAKINHSPYAEAIQLDARDDGSRKALINKADIVISLLPPQLHILVANDCLAAGKNLLTASYIDDDIRYLERAINAKGLLFLYEMGLDPGMDHMSAMQMIEETREEGGKITSFKSHCGGLVAPESDDNPWHYKISWNPRNILMAGKGGAVFKLENKIEHLSYENLFSNERFVDVPGLGYLCWYPNRDSLQYIPLYHLEEASTFIRTTLRHPDFMYGWKNVVDLKLTDENELFDSDGKSLMDFFRHHFDKHGFSGWVEEKMMARFSETKELLENLIKLSEAETLASKEGLDIPDDFMVVHEKGDLEKIELDDIKNRAASAVAHKMHEANLTLKQLFFLGMNDEDTMINKGKCSPADVMQLALEKKLALQPADKDMVVMLHEIEYAVDNRRFEKRSSLVVKGEDSMHTAMAKTVGLPLGIAAKLILSGRIPQKGLQIPVAKEIYDPVLEELEKYNIRFEEVVKVLT